MDSPKYIGRCGAMVVALGMGAGLAAIPWSAYAKPADPGSAGGCSSSCSVGGQSGYGFLAPGTGGVNSDGKAEGFYVKFQAGPNAPFPDATVRNSGNSFAGHLSLSGPFQGTFSGATPPNSGGETVGHSTGEFGDCSGRGC
jgi:hypothetical protein